MALLDVPHTEGSAIALGAVVIMWVGLLTASTVFSRRGANDGGKRDSRSIAGIAVQGLGVGAAWWGRASVVVSTAPSAWIDAAPAVAIALLSLVLFVWAVRTMGKNWAVVAQTRGDHQLVQNGPFALIRNPIYVAIFGMMVSSALAIGHAYNLIVAVPLFIIGTMMRVGLEEKLLHDTFGQAYDQYRKRVKRFVPTIW